MNSESASPKDVTLFANAYSSLNAAQKQAVDTIEGPVMVIAGPGTGKTQILTLRIANILLKTDAKPENILALTFTDAGAKAMRERLHRYIGSTAFKVPIFTFHGFAERLIREYPDAYARVVGARPASDLDSITIMERILEDSAFKLLRPMGDPKYYVKHLLREITALKKEYIGPDALASLIAKDETVLENMEKVHQKGAHKGKVRGEYTKKEKSIAKNKELLHAYRLYEASLTEARLYDFEDMIVETVRAMSQHEDMLRDLQETYQYVLADEHQDVNGSQNKILELLCNFHDTPNIFVVGDEKQAIYRFQGASLENFLYFTDVFPATKTISLTQNYRSGQAILDAAHDLVAVDEGPLKALRVPLTAAAVNSAVVERRVFSHQAIEDDWVVSRVQAALDEDVPPSEIAVIVRTNREVEQLSAQLRKQGLVVEASADGDILDHPIVHTIFTLVDAVVGNTSEEALFAVLHGGYWGLSPSDVVKICAARSYNRSLATILADTEYLTEIGVQDVAAAQNIIATIDRARNYAATTAPHRVLEHLLKDSGFLQQIMRQEPIEGGRVVRRLYDEIEKMVLFDARTTLREVRDVLNLYKAHRLALTAPYIATNDEAVQVMTAHKSKGLEFAVVIVPHIIDSVWGGATKRTYFDVATTVLVDSAQFDVVDDERRLLYVAMTRAKNQLYLSSSEQNMEGKELISSRLFDDISENLLPICSTESAENSFDPTVIFGTPLITHPLDTALLITQLRRRGISATALNNYLSSPYTYLYRNILRVPEAQTTSLQFGTAIHGVLEWLCAEKQKHNTLPNMSAVKENLEMQLGRLPIHEVEYARLHQKGFESLSAYLPHLESSLTTEVAVETAISVILPTGIPTFPEVTLTGKLDRIDFDADGKALRVVDYKTGKPKTRGEIEGTTKNSNGDYKRQLVFYALLLSLYDDDRFATKTGVLSFVQPDNKGVIHEELFEITDEEIEALKSEIIMVVEQIITGAFLKTPCDPKVCDYCELAATLLQGK